MKTPPRFSSPVVNTLRKKVNRGLFQRDRIALNGRKDQRINIVTPSDCVLSPKFNTLPPIAVKSTVFLNLLQGWFSFSQGEEQAKVLLLPYGQGN